MSMASKLSKLANIFSNDKKSNAQAQAQTTAAEIEATQERARKELLKLTRTARVGFPHRPTCIAYDPVQHMVAVGTRQGFVKLYGGESIEYTISHASQQSASLNNTGGAQSFEPVASVPGFTGNSGNDSPVATTSSTGMAGKYAEATPALIAPAVLFMSFVINEGALITLCDDSTISFWNLRQKQPGVLFSRKLVNERGTAMYLPFQSNWLFIGTEKGNTYLLNIYNNFSQSGYDIKWNNVIELSQKNKPGKVVHLSDHPLEPTKILIGFDSGLCVLWNLKIKRPEFHYYGTSEAMSSIGWFYDGKQFMSAHNNGSLIVWSTKGETKPVNILHPHMNETDMVPRYNMIRKVNWESTSKNDQLIIFSDGLPSTDCVMRDAITIIKNNRLKTIIEMKDRVVDFVIIPSSPWTTETPTDPIALIALLDSQLVVIDLRSEGYPQFQHHHPTGLHESQLTATFYLTDPSKQFFKSLVAARDKYLAEQRLVQQQAQLAQQKQAAAVANGAVATNASGGGVTTSKQVYSPLPYPICGGLRCTKSNVFGYQELVVTGHEDGSVKLWDSTGLGLVLLHKFKTQKLFDKRKLEGVQVDVEAPYKITVVTHARNYLAVAAAGGHVTLYKFYSKCPTEDGLADIPLFEIPIEYNSEMKSAGESTNLPNDFVNKKELKCFLRTKIGFRKQQGFQPELVCLLYWSQRPPVVTSINIYPKTNILLFGTDESIVGVDFVTRTMLINVSLVDFYGTQDPFNRGHKSPKKNNIKEVDEIEPSFLQRQSTVDHVEKKDEIKEIKEIKDAKKQPRRFSMTALKHKLESLTVVPGSAAHSPTHPLPPPLPPTCTIEESDNKKEAISRSSSCASLENLALSEGVSYISINDYAPTLITNNKTDVQQQIIQVWVGTTYGSVIVLNATSTLNGPSGVDAANASGGIAGASQGSSVSSGGANDPLNQKTITPSGSTVYSLKGQVLDISFLDTNGALVCNNICRDSWASGSTVSSSMGATDIAAADDEEDLNNLDIDFSYLASSNLSNSIASQFMGGNTPAATGSTNSGTGSDVNNNSSAANNQYDDNIFGAPPQPPSAPSSGNSFMNTFNPATFGQSFDDTTLKASNKTNKKSLAMTKSSKADFGVTQDQGTTITLSDKNQFAILTSEQQIKVIGLPSQSCIYKYSITEGTVAKASVCSVNFLTYLTCYMTNGNFLVFNLPNPTLKTNLNLNPPILPHKEKELLDRSIRTFAFGGNGHSIYMCSPSEIQKIYLSASTEGALNLTDMLSEFFDPKIVTPQAPKPNLFKSLFSSTPFDREELFGESSGKPSTSIVKNVDNEAVRAKKELTELQKLALERGEKLSALQMKTEEMTMAASEFAKNASALATKYKDKSKRFGF